MAIDGIAAGSAYARLGALAGRGPVPPAASGDAGMAAPGFGDLVGGVVDNGVTALKAADRATTAHLLGKGDMIDLVTAIGAAETALDTMVAVRDRMVSAYGDIMRMQI